MRSILKSRRRLLQYEPLEARRLLAITVDTLVDEADGSIVDGDISLRDALAFAPSAETIDFESSLDGGTILLELGELVITDALTIDATALTTGLTIDASGNDPTPDEDNGDGSRVFHVDDGNDSNNIDLELRALTLTGGDVSGSGGAIYSRESLTLAESVITGNSASDSGGGIGLIRPASGDAAMTITSSTITENSAQRHGGGIHFDSPSEATMTITSSTVTGNTAGFGGGGISAWLIYGTTMTITSSTISGNSAVGFGGGISSYMAYGTRTIASSTITGNSAAEGGGIWVRNFPRFGATMTISSSTISGNSVSGNGGGIDVYGDVSVTSSTISGNSADFNGGGIFARSGEAGDITITSSKIEGNSAGRDGGGIDTWNEQFGFTTVTSSTISGNTAGRDGGGIRAETKGYAEVRINSSTISSNVADGSGGGVYANMLERYAGVRSLSVSVRHSTIAGNVADADGDGGGSQEGGGILATGIDGMTLDHTIVADNARTSASDDVSGMVTANFSLIGDDTGAVISGASNILNQDPLLGPLANNGGPTQTHALLLASPAIDTGDSAFTSPPDFDQRAFPFIRVFGARIDIGAYESQTADMDFDGDADFDDIDAFVLGLTDPDDYEVQYGAPPNSNGDTDGDGDLDFDDIDDFVAVLNANLFESSVPLMARSTDPIVAVADAAPATTMALPPQTLSQRLQVGWTAPTHANATAIDGWITVEVTNSATPIGGYRESRTAHAAIHGATSIETVRANDLRPRRLSPRGDRPEWFLIARRNQLVDHGTPTERDLAAVWSKPWDWLGEVHRRC